MGWTVGSSFVLFVKCNTNGKLEVTSWREGPQDLEVQRRISKATTWVDQGMEWHQTMGWRLQQMPRHPTEQYGSSRHGGPEMG